MLASLPLALAAVSAHWQAPLPTLATAGRSVLLLDGQWRLTNEGVGPMPTRTYTVLRNHSLVDAPRGSWSQYPAPQLAHQTALQVRLPAVATAEECCDACAKTAGCGAAVWDGYKCEARAANSVPVRTHGGSCKLLPSSDFHPGCIGADCLGEHSAADPSSCCTLCSSTTGCAGAVLVGTACYLTAASGTAGGTYTRSGRTVCIPENKSADVAQQVLSGPAACVLSGGAVDIVATVPGDVNDELMKAKLLPNLLVGTNSMEARWVPQYEWRYERTFTLPSIWTLTTASSVALHFAGIDYNCSVSLNGHILVAAHAGSFRPINLLDVTSVLKSGTDVNTLIVTIHAPPAGYLNALFVDFPQGGARTTYTAGGYQRDHFSAWKAGVGNGGGVDFGTPAFSLGIWKSVELRYSAGGGTATLDGDHASAIPAFPAGQSASLSVASVALSIPVRFAPSASSPVRLVWSISCIPETGCGSGLANNSSPPPSVLVAVVPEPGSACKYGCTVHSEANITVHQPELWWPNGYGAQKLYMATATLSDVTGHVPLDAVQFRFGMRKLELTDNVPHYPREIRAMQSTGFPFADYGSCPVQSDCNANGWSEHGKPPCTAPAGRTDCACPWCGGPWVRNSSGPAGPDHLPGQGPLPPNGPRNITQGDATQTGWTMVINNRRVFARGANWVPVDLFFGRVTDAWLEQAVALSKAANMNFFRVWGGGIIEKKAFFDACDTHGIMLLSEMAHMGPRPHEVRDGISDERASQILLGEAIDTTAAVFQLINHPSVVQWGYANEEYVNTSWSTSLDQYERIVRTYDPSRPVHAANPIPYAQRHGPYNFYTHRDQAGLACNSYDTYNWGMGAEGTSSGSPCGFTEGTGNIATGPAWPYEWDEVGACGMCSLEQLEAIIPDESVRWPINGTDPKSAAWHWHAAFGVQRNDTWLSPSSYRWLFMPPRGPNGTWSEPLPTLKDEFEASQFLQAEGYRYIFQSNRRARWHRSAVAIWTLNEPFPNAAHGCIFDYSGHPKHAFYLSQESLAPLDVSIRYDRIWSRAGVPINATVYIDDESQCDDSENGPVVIAEAWSAKRGKLLHTQTWSLPSLDSQVVTEVGQLDYVPPLEMIGDTVLLLLEARTNADCDTSSPGCALSRHSYTFGVVAPPGTSNASPVGDDVVAPLAALRAANTTCVVVTGTRNITVRNTGANVALNVKLSGHNEAKIDDMQSSVLVEWVAFDASYFSLRPGETRYVQLLHLGGYQNVTSVSVSSWNQQC